MSIITSLGPTDSGSVSRGVINTNIQNLNTDKIETSVISTDGTLAGNSDTELPTERAVKTYVDAFALPEGELRATTVSFSSAEILDLHNTEKILIAAPGAGKLIVVDEVVTSLTAGTQYSGGNAMAVRYLGETVQLVNNVPAAAITSATSIIYRLVALSDAITANQNITAGINKAVKIGVSSAFLTGTGTWKMFIRYRILTL